MQDLRSNQDWIAELKRPEPGNEEALEDLRRLLFRAAHYTLTTHASDLDGMPDEARRALAEECTQEALITVLEKLDDFRGESKFTTWVYKFGVNIALSRGKRWRWRQVSLEAMADAEDSYEWLFTPDNLNYLDSERQIRQKEITGIIRDVVANQLTARQRQVLKLIAFDEVPMDVVTEQQKTNRNAVYKTLHDARLKLRQQLVRSGYDLDEILSLFQ